jgi:hypothetical protein
MEQTLIIIWKWLPLYEKSESKDQLAIHPVEGGNRHIIAVHEDVFQQNEKALNDWKDYFLGLCWVRGELLVLCHSPKSSLMNEKVKNFFEDLKVPKKKFVLFGGGREAIYYDTHTHEGLLNGATDFQHGVKSNDVFYTVFNPDQTIKRSNFLGVWNYYTLNCFKAPIYKTSELILLNMLIYESPTGVKTLKDWMVDLETWEQMEDFHNEEHLHPIFSYNMSDHSEKYLSIIEAREAFLKILDTPIVPSFLPQFRKTMREIMNAIPGPIFR